MDFVAKHPGHTKVCDWCKKAPEPKEKWKWDEDSQVWYKYYDGKWHYWGPSKDGFTANGWSWYKGYWHHDGYVFKYENNKWYRFQGKKWVEYGDQVPVKPERPRGPKDCRKFHILRQKGFPNSLAAKTVPRCKVGEGNSSAIYMWQDDAACKFLGGKKVDEPYHVCKTGTAHKWEEITKCVQGEIISGKGLNYTTG